MFVGIVRSEAASKGLYIWDIRANTVSKYSNHTEFCYADGYIHAREFHIDRADQTVRPIRYGTLGQEKDDTCDVSTGKGCHGPLNMSCKPVEYPIGSLPLGEESVLGIQLRSGDGVLVTMTRRVSATRPESVEERRERFKKPLLLLNKRYPSGKALPITAMEGIGARGTAYSSFAKRYVLVPSRLSDVQAGHSTNWPEGRPQPVYLMTPEGDVETIQVPSRPDWNTVQLSLPAVHGLVFLGSGAHGNEWGGIFLYDKGDVWGLDRGKAEALAISPDGCKAAYSIFNDFGKSRTNIARVKSIDFCKRG
jgi:hypothetical protein